MVVVVVAWLTVPVPVPYVVYKKAYVCRCYVLLICASFFTFLQIFSEVEGFSTHRRGRGAGLYDGRSRVHACRAEGRSHCHNAEQDSHSEHTANENGIRVRAWGVLALWVTRNPLSHFNPLLYQHTQLTVKCSSNPKIPSRHTISFKVDWP